MTEGDGDWVFGYGSLMWRPGFHYREAVPAVLNGYHRSFCVYSHYYRGTPLEPGLVLGLAPRGRCQGLAFRVPTPQFASVKAYLDERELVSYAYRATYLPLETPRGEVLAYTFVRTRATPNTPGSSASKRPLKSLSGLAAGLASTAIT